MNIVVNTDFINTIITSIITSEIIGVFISEYYQRKTLVKKNEKRFLIIGIIIAIILFFIQFILHSPPHLTNTIKNRVIQMR